jgi:phosphoglycolate phosphatase
MDNNIVVKPEVILFDLDGTLIDTADEIVDAVNDAVAPLTNGELLDHGLVKSWIGNGARVLFSSALRHCGIAEDDLETEFAARWDDFHRFYGERCGTNSQLYSDVSNCLEALIAHNYRLGIVTNKERAFAVKAIKQHKIENFFEILLAGDTLPVKKPDPQMLWVTIEQLSVESSKVLFVGDSMVDVATGAAAGVRTWALRHGYHHGAFEQPLSPKQQPERFLNSFAEMQELLV